MTLPYDEIIRGIRNIRRGPIVRDENDQRRATVEFDFRGGEIRITEPTDILLADDHPSRHWLAENYEVLLTFFQAREPANARHLPFPEESE